MLNEYKGDSIWKDNIDTVNIRSDILVTKRVIDLLGSVKGKKILDIGCGNGKTSRIFEEKSAEVFAVDKLEEQIRTAQSVPSRVHYFVGDVTDLECLNLPKDFDIVISSMTFLYLNKEEFVRSLEQIKIHLKPKGRFVYGDINPSRYGEQETVSDSILTVEGKLFQTTFYNHSLDFIKTSFANAGFRIEEILAPLPTETEVKTYSNLLLDKDTPQYLIIDTILM